MKLVSAERSYDGISLRNAALIAGFAYWLNPVTYAEFSIYPRLVVANNADQTVQFISAHMGLLGAAILCYIINWVGDVTIAWALYILLAPVNRSLSLLASLFQLVYTAVAICSAFGLLDVYHLLASPYYLTVFGSGPLHAQVWLHMHTFRYEYSTSLIFFGIHLILLGYLVFRSRYVPWILGISLSIAGLGYVISGGGQYLLPSTNFRFAFMMYAGELPFALWLVIRGWKVREPSAIGSAGAIVDVP